MNRLSKRISAAVGATLFAAAGAGAVAMTSTSAGAAVNQTSFNMVRSGAAVAAGANCLTNASAKVTIQSQGPVEVMKVSASKLPPNTDFDLFVIQVPNKPFGIGWYQGDLESDSSGNAQGTFIGRFSIETFAVAQGAASAPAVFNKQPFPDATTNPLFNPVQMYHLGLWFNSPNDASKAGCGATVTPFNGEHNAGVQALSTRNFSDQFGPLRNIQP